jgi:hypothetical protein
MTGETQINYEPFKVVVIGGKPMKTELSAEFKALDPTRQDSDYLLIQFMPLIKTDEDGDIILGNDSCNGKARNFALFPQQSVYYNNILQILNDPNRQHKRYKLKVANEEVEAVELTGVKMTGAWLDIPVPDGYTVMNRKTGTPLITIRKGADGKYFKETAVAYKVTTFLFANENPQIRITDAVRRIKPAIEYHAKMTAHLQNKKEVAEAAKNAAVTNPDPAAPEVLDENGNKI